MKVGFIGLGRMGKGMARRVLDGGHQLAVYDVVREATAEFGAVGARVASSVADLCDGPDVVITMLVEDATVLDVVLAAGGMRDSLPERAIHLAMGTYGVAAIRALADAHATANQVLVAAPVLGRPDLAASGQLGIVAAGPPDAIKRCGPLFEVLGRRTFEAGIKPESATAIKLANNLVLGAAIVAQAEAFSLVRKYGVLPQIFYDVMTDGLFASSAYKVYGKIIVEESYDKVGQIAVLGLKDANLALAAGETAGVPLPSGNVWRDRLVGAVAHGDGGKDWTVMALEQARASGLE